MELRYYLTYVYLSIYGNTVLVFPFTSPYEGLFVRYQIRNVQLYGGGLGKVGAARWHTGKEVTTATLWWLKVHMMPVRMRRNLQPTCQDRDGG